MFWARMSASSRRNRIFVSQGAKINSIWRTNSGAQSCKQVRNSFKTILRHNNKTLLLHMLQNNPGLVPWAKYWFYKRRGMATIKPRFKPTKLFCLGKPREQGLGKTTRLSTQILVSTKASLLNEWQKMPQGELWKAVSQFRGRLTATFAKKEAKSRSQVIFNI